MKRQKLLLHLSLINGVGTHSINKLTKLTDFLNIKNFTPKDFNKIGLHEKISNFLYYGLKDNIILQQELNLIAQKNINWTTILDEDYPALLKNIENPPPIIYWKGTHPKKLKTPIAIVGSRKASHYCEKVADYILTPLIQNNFTIVSGGAVGADAIAHTLSIKNNSPTISIIGSGLLNPYPQKNFSLFKKILETNGTLLSSFPLKTPPQPQNFPIRNRIISGLSLATIVLQAAQKSGALITANLALEQGREVGAVPGDIFDELSAGCHKLILQGATPITSPEDITHMLGFTFKSKLIQQKIKLNFEEEPPDIQQILTLCKNPISFDELLENIKLNPEELHQKLFELKLSKKLKQDFMGLWFI